VGLDAPLPLQDQIDSALRRMDFVESELRVAQDKVNSLIEAQKSLVGVVMDLVAQRGSSDA